MELVELTRELAAIPSHHEAGERRATRAVASWLRSETDAAVTVDPDGNVIARRTGGDGATGSSGGDRDGDGNDDPGERGSDRRNDGSDDRTGTLALVGHHDVVPPADGQVAERSADGGGDGGDDGDGDGRATRLRVDRRGDRLYGRGTADMKGALAAAMVAFRDADPDGELVLASFAGEEQGGVGCRAAVDRGFAPDRAVVCEGSTGYSAPGTTDVAVAHRGRRETTLTATGESAHASEPGAGVNAVGRACRAVDRVESLSLPATWVAAAERHVEGSVAVTRIEGGTARNVIPDRCTVTVDERTVPGDRLDLGPVEAVEGVSATVEQDLPPMACADGAFADRVLSAAAAAQDGTPARVVKPHATDAGWLTSAGVDCLVCGPAEPGEAHTDAESVSIPVLRRCRRIYEQIVG